LKRPVTLDGVDWALWEEQEERWAKEAPWGLRNGIIWRREAVANPRGKQADPESLAFLRQSLAVLERIATRLGVLV
jgi:hypothetical protein